MLRAYLALHLQPPEREGSAGMLLLCGSGAGLCSLSARPCAEGDSGATGGESTLLRIRLDPFEQGVRIPRCYSQRLLPGGYSTGFSLSRPR